MIFDTDVLIWVLRGSAKAARAVNQVQHRALSVVSYMELIQGARDKQESRTIKSYLADLQFEMVPLTENIGHRAAIYMEEYGLSGSLSMADALIAATAVESNLEVLTGNVRHYRPIKEVQIQTFRP